MERRLKSEQVRSMQEGEEGEGCCWEAVTQKIGVRGAAGGSGVARAGAGTREV